MKSHEVPEGWELKKITDISEIISGSTPSTSVQKYWDGSIVWITPDDLSINDSIYLKTSSRKITENGLKNSSARIIPYDSIVMSSRAPIGYLAIMKVDFATNQGCKSFKLKNDNPEFVYYLLSFNMPRIKQQGEGTTFSEISKSQLGKVKLSLPKSQKEQQKIASILLTIDKAIEKTKALIEKNKKIKLGLMRDLIENVCEENGKLPEKWKIKAVSSICYKPEYGYTESAQEKSIGPKFLRITDIQDGEVKWDEVPYCKCPSSTLNKYKLAPDDILFARTGATTGKSFIIEKCPEAVYASYLIRIKTKEEVIPRYLYYFFNSSLYWNQVNRYIGGSAQGGINASLLSKIKVQFPTKEEQEKIVQRIDSIGQKILAEDNYLQKMQKIKGGLMQDLLTWKVRIKVAA